MERGNSLTITSRGAFQMAVLLANGIMQRLLLEVHLLTERERERESE